MSQQFRQLGSVLRVFVDAQLQVLPERFVKLRVVVLVLRDFVEHLDALLDDVLLDDFQDFVLLQHLA